MLNKLSNLHNLRAGSAVLVRSFSSSAAAASLNTDLDAVEAQR